MNLSDNLKKIRKDNNLSQEALAEKLGVSRQAVSKWESGVAYPEMDKVLQLCEMFNLNIDELLNQDIGKIEKNKKSKVNINKYIDDFLSFFTKTINMFGAMKFKDKMKCIFEQLFIAFILFIASLLIGAILSEIIENLLIFLPNVIYYNVYNAFEGIYYLIALFLGIIILLHIFKTRYLDYYEESIKDDKQKIDEVSVDKEEIKETKKESKKKISFNKKEEKIIIRDEKHSSYGFINGLLKVLIFFIKVITFFIALPFCFSLLGFIVLLVISFVFIKTGLLFIGIFLTLISLIIFNTIILYLAYNFIVNRNIKKLLTFVLFIISIIVGGIGIGLSVIGVKDFKYINTFDEKYMIHKEENYEMDKELFINNYYSDVEYIETNDNNIKLVYEYTPYCEIKSIKDDNSIYFINECNNEIVNLIIKTINEKVVLDPDYLKIYVYTNKQNINILKANKIKFYDNLINDDNYYE